MSDEHLAQTSTQTAQSQPALNPVPDFSFIKPSPLYETPELKKMIDALQQARDEGKTVVLASGAFDLFHAEHQNYLRKSKEIGDVLVVAVESDVRVRKLKGEGRPVQPQEQRLSQVKAFEGVDYAFLLPDDFNNPIRYQEIVYHLRPQIYACSSHSPFQYNKTQMMAKYGGKLQIVLQENPEVSTTKLTGQA